MSGTFDYQIAALLLDEDILIHRTELLLGSRATTAQAESPRLMFANAALPGPHADGTPVRYCCKSYVGTIGEDGCVLQQRPYGLHIDGINIWNKYHTMRIAHR